MTTVTAGITTTDLDDTTPEALAQKLIGSTGTVSGATFTGSNVAGGLFTNAASGVGIDEGVVLSSGRIGDIGGVNDCMGWTGRNGQPGDSDLEKLINLPTHDAAVLQFDVVSNTGALNFQFVFASEEYDENVNEEWDDVGMIAVDGQNIAIIPGDAQSHVSVNTINNGNPLGTNAHHPELYLDNAEGLSSTVPLQMDGLTRVLAATAPVQVGTTHHVKIAVADATDDTEDSAIFVGAGLPPFTYTPNNYYPEDHAVVIRHPDSYVFHSQVGAIGGTVDVYAPNNAAWATISLEGAGTLVVHEFGAGKARLAIDGNTYELQGQCAGAIQAFPITGTGTHSITIDSIVEDGSSLCTIKAWAFDGFEWDGTTPTVSCNTDQQRTMATRDHVVVSMARGLPSTWQEEMSVATAVADDAENAITAYLGYGFSFPTMPILIKGKCGDGRNYWDGGDKAIFLPWDSNAKGWGSSALNPREDRRWVIAHELIHATQWSSPTQAEGWPLESTATLGPDLVPISDDNPDAQYYRFFLSVINSPVEYTYQSDGTLIRSPDRRNLYYYVHENAWYELASLIAYLGDRYGSGSTSEARAADFMRKLASRGSYFDALANVMGGADRATEGVRDYYLTAYLHSYGASSPYVFSDELYPHGQTSSGSPQPPRYPTLNVVTPPFTASGSFSATYTSSVAAPGGTLGAIELNPSADVPSIHARTGSSCVRVDISALNVTAGVPVIAGKYAVVAWDTPTSWRLASGSTGTIANTPSSSMVTICNITSATKLAVIAVAGGVETSFKITETDATPGSAIELGVSQASPASPDENGWIRIPVHAVDSGHDNWGLLFENFDLRVDGKAEAYRLLPIGGYYNLFFKDPNLASGWHDVSVTVAGASASASAAIFIPSTPPGPKPQIAKALAGDNPTDPAAITLGAAVTTDGSGGSPLAIQAGVIDSRGTATNVAITASVTGPTGVGRVYEMRDDAAHDDVQAGDGIFGIDSWASELAGTYSVHFVATGDDATGQSFVLTADATAIVAASVDSDGDGIADAIEPRFGLNPHDATDGARDVDGDGLSWASELANDTDPLAFDTDGGGIGDGAEVRAGGNPRNAIDDGAVGTITITAEPADGSLTRLTATASASGNHELWRLDATGHAMRLGSFTDGLNLTDGPLAPGLYEYIAYGLAADGTRLTAASSGRVSVAPDVTKPQAYLSINRGATVTASRSVSLRIERATEPVAGIRFAESPLTLPAEYSPFTASTAFTLSSSEGRHVVYAQVRDAAGNESEIFSAPIDLDNAAPTSRTGSVPAGIEVPTLVVPVEAADTGSGVLRVQLYVRKAVGRWWGAWSPIGESVGAPISVTLPYGEGVYQLATVATDVAGNIEALPTDGDATVDYDTRYHLLPTTHIGPAVAFTQESTLQIPLTVVDHGGGVASVEVWFRCHDAGDPTWANWYSYTQRAVPGSPTYTAYLSCLNYGDAAFEFYSIGVDSAGHREPIKLTPDTSTFLDVHGPSSRAGALPARVSSTSLVVPFAADDGYGSGIDHVDLYESNPTTGWHLEATAATSPFTVSLDQGPGTYSFYTIAVDRAGFVEPRPCCGDLWFGPAADTSTIYDPTAPQLSSKLVAPLTLSTVTPTVAFEYAAAYPSGSGSVELWRRVKLPGASDFGPWQINQTTSAWPIAEPLDQGDGTYEFYSIAVDSGGSRSATPAAAEASVLLDRTPPQSSVGALPSTITETTAAIPCLGTDLGSGISSMTVFRRWRAQDGDPWTDWRWSAACQPGETPSFSFPEGEGFYEFSSYAVDALGNREAGPGDVDATTYFAPPPVSHIEYVPEAQRGGLLNVSATSTTPWELWERHAAPGSNTFTDWTLAGHAAATDPVGFTLVDDGRYEFYSIAVSASGTREAPPAVADAFIICDRVAPTSSITSVPPRTTSPSVPVAFTASDGAGAGVASVWIEYRYRQSQDATWSSWQYLTSIDSPATSGPVSLPSGEGFYEFISRGEDVALNVEAQASIAQAWTHYTTGTEPASSVGRLPIGTNAASFTVPYIADFASGGGSLELWESFAADGITFGPYAKVATATAPSPLVATLGQGEGTYRFYTVAIDGASGVREAIPADADGSLILDTTPPESSTQPPTIVTASQDYFTLESCASDTATGIAAVELYWRFAPAGTANFNNWRYADTQSWGPCPSFALAFDGGDGTYEFYSRAIDGAGNREAPPSSADTILTLDTKAPSSKAGPVAAAVKTSSLSIPYTGSDNENGSGLARVDLYRRFQAAGSTDWTGWDFVTEATSSPISTSLNRGPGRYEFYTIACDNAGGCEYKETADTFTVLDRTAPVTSVGPLAALTNSKSLSLPFSAADLNGSGVATVQVQQRYKAAGGSSFGSWSTVATVTNPAATGFVPITLGNDGTYEFRSIGIDAATNSESAPSTADATIVLDATAPVSAAGSLPASTTGSSINVSFTATDTNGSGVTGVELWQRFQPAGGSMGAWTQIASGTTSPFTVPLAADGRYEFYTRGTDTAGNREDPPSAFDAYTVRDSTLPATNAGPLAAAVKSTALSVPYTVTSGAVGSVELWQRYQAAGSSSWSTWAKGPTITSAASSGTFSVTLGSGAGRYEFYTLGVSPTGTSEAPPSAADAFTVLDTTAPTSSITAPQSTTTAPSIAIPYTASDNTNGSGLATVECWYRFKASDSATAGAWTSCGSATGASGSLTISFAQGAGIYEFLTVAVDAAGNREGGTANPPATAASPKSFVRAVAWSASVKVNTDAGSAVQDNLAFAIGSDGTVYAVWEDSRNTSTGTDIYFAQRNPTTGLWSTEVKVNTDTGSAGQRTPAIAVDGAGNVYVVWADDRSGATNTDIYFAKRTGTTWGANGKVNSDSATAIQSNPRIAVTSAGMAVAVWYDRRSSQTNIYSARLNIGSSTWTNYNVTSSNTSSVKAAPDITMASNGTAWAAWQDNRTGGGDIYVASLGPSATSWSTNAKASDDSTSSGLDQAARIGVTSAGSPVVAWIDGRSTTPQVRVATKGSSTWNASVQVSDSAARPAGGLALSVKASGGVIVAWDDTRATTSAIWGTQCEAGTSSVARCAGPEKWSDQTGAASHPAIASNGVVFVGWRDATTDSGDVRVRLRMPS